MLNSIFYHAGKKNCEARIYKKLNFQRHLSMNRKTYLTKESENKQPLYHCLTYNMFQAKEMSKFRSQEQKSREINRLVDLSCPSLKIRFRNLIVRMVCLLGYFSGAFLLLLWLMNKYVSLVLLLYSFYSSVDFAPVLEHWILFFPVMTITCRS